MITEADEEKMIAAAIEASLCEAGPKATPPRSTLQISQMEKENVGLFAQVIDKMLAMGAATVDSDIQSLANAMDALKQRIKNAILTDPGVSSVEVSSLLNNLELALSKYQRLLIPSHYAQPPSTLYPPVYNPTVSSHFQAHATHVMPIQQPLHGTSFIPMPQQHPYSQPVITPQQPQLIPTFSSPLYTSPSNPTDYQRQQNSSLPTQSEKQKEDAPLIEL
jgi:hypothetical protein